MDAPRADAGDRAVEADEVEGLRQGLVGAEPSDEAEPRTVVREVRRGWRLPDGLLRPAQVVVATGEEPARPWR